MCSNWSFWAEMITSVRQLDHSRKNWLKTVLRLLVYLRCRCWQVKIGKMNPILRMSRSINSMQDVNSRSSLESQTVFRKGRSKISRAATFPNVLRLSKEKVIIIVMDRNYHHRSQWTSATSQKSSTASGWAGVWSVIPLLVRDFQVQDTSNNSQELPAVEMSQPIASHQTKL